MKKVRVTFKPESFFINKIHTYENVIEVHYNYDNSGKIAIECENTGYVLPINQIQEFETFE
jgi:hypothetical protein